MAVVVFVLEVPDDHAGLEQGVPVVAGRKSGRVYTTPLTSSHFGDGFQLPLPYGPQVDWCRNTVAAGRPY